MESHLVALQVGRNPGLVLVKEKVGASLSAGGADEPEPQLSRLQLLLGRGSASKVLKG